MYSLEQKLVSTTAFYQTDFFVNIKKITFFFCCDFFEVLKSHLI